MIPRGLKLLVLNVSTRCDQACAHCSIWRPRPEARQELSLAARLSLIDQAGAASARDVLFTGGEPLLCDHLETLARRARRLGLGVQIATNGLGLGRAAAWIVECVNELYVSLEGPPPIHETVRGAGMFARLRTSIATLRGYPGRPRLIARSVVSKLNAAHLCETVEAARSLGFDAISFLPIDTQSSAFGGEPQRRAHLRPRAEDIALFREGIRRLDAVGDTGAFVVESTSKLRWLATRLEEEKFDAQAPPCDAPEWSVVVEADGSLRPCFFQPSAGEVGGDSLAAARDSEEFKSALRTLGPGNRVCATCVCPKRMPNGVELVRLRVGAAIRSIVPKHPGGRGRAA